MKTYSPSQIFHLYINYCYQRSTHLKIAVLKSWLVYA